MKYNYKPSLAEMRSSLKYRSKEYFLENTLHGVPYFVDQTRPKWERITGFFLTMASIVSIIVIILIIWNKFQTEPTITGLDLETDNINVEFPQVFVCIDWNRLDRFDLTGNEMYLYGQLYNWTWGTMIDYGSSKNVYKNRNNFRSVFRKMVPDCGKLFNNCAYKNVKTPCSELFTKVLAIVGACCKLNSVEPLKATDSSFKLEFETTDESFPWRLYFTQRVDWSPQPSDKPIAKAYFPTDVEFTVEATYATPEIRYLLLKQRECHFKQEGVSLSNCEIDCIVDMIFERCKCLPWFLSSANKTECPLSRYSCLNFHGVDTSRCDCWLPCDHTSYSVRSVTKSADNVSRIVLRNWPATRYRREMRFGFLDLLVSFGGIASLFVGYSLFASVEFGYYFSLRTYCGAVIQSSRKKYNILTVHVLGKSDFIPPRVDVEPKYYQYVD